MGGTSTNAQTLPEVGPPRRPSGLARLVALMAAHRDSLATADGGPRPLEQCQIDRIVDGLSGEPRRRGQAGQH